MSRWPRNPLLPCNGDSSYVQTDATTLHKVETTSISREETLPCKPLTVLFNSSIFESSLLSLSKIRSSFFVTPSVRFRAAITWSSSSEFFESGEYECLNFFPSGDDSSELLDVARFLDFLFGVNIDTGNFHRRPNKSTISGALRNTSYISNSLPSLPDLVFFDNPHFFPSGFAFRSHVSNEKGLFFQ